MNFKTVKEFNHAGFECEIVEVDVTPHIELSHNGYVTVPKDHPCYGKHYNNIDQDVTELTFSSDEGEFGFDTNHIYDDENTKSLEAVIAVTKELADRFKELEDK